MKIRLFINILFGLLIMVSVSCNHDSKRIRKRDLIPEKELVPLMTDLYIGDGLLQYQPVRSKFSTKDTITNYIDIIKKHGYSKEKMDKTLLYYFVNDPKKLQKIYDQVLARLSEIQSRLETDKPVTASNNLWSQKTSFLLPDEGTNNAIYFDIPISDTGYYSLSLSAVLFKNDMSINPRITVFFRKTDSAGNQVKKLWNRTDLIRDDLSHIYAISGRISDTSYKHISGFLLDCDLQNGPWEKHAKITNIRLTKGPLE